MKAKKIIAGLLSAALVATSIVTFGPSQSVVNAASTEVEAANEMTVKKYTQIEQSVLKPNATANSYQSATGNNSPEAAFDGVTTGDAIWHQSWGAGKGSTSAASKSNPIYIQTGFGTTDENGVYTSVEKTVGRLVYYGKEDQNNRINEYAIQVVNSTEQFPGDDAGWKTVATGNFVDETKGQIVNFDAEVATHIRLVAYSGNGRNEHYVSASEVQVFTVENVVTNNAKVVRHEGSSVMENTSAQLVVDGQFDNPYKVSPRNGDRSRVGDYIGLVYDGTFSMKNVKFVFDKSSLGDTFEGCKLQYLPSGQDAATESNWKDVLVDGRVVEWNSDRVPYVSVELPEPIDADGVRISCTKDSTRNMWIRLNEIQLNQDVTIENYESTDVEFMNLYARQGSDPANSNAASHGNGPGSYAIDGDLGTNWHTNYNGITPGENAYRDMWIELEMSYEMLIDGLRVYAKNHDNGNIVQYKVMVSSNGTDYITVCEGSWDNTVSNCWKDVKFEPVRAKYVKLQALETKNNPTPGAAAHANVFTCLTEMRITKATEDMNCFIGGALRMDLPNDYTKTFLRFMYKIPVNFGGMTLDTANKWGWRYSVASAADVENKTVTPVAELKYALDEVAGIYESNIVFKNIGEANYARPVYTQLVVNYKNTNNETLKVYSSVSERSVQQVAQGIVDKNTGVEGKEDQVTYAIRILGKEARLATANAQFNGALIGLEDCLYTFTGTETENVYKIQSGNLYLNTKTGNNVNIPNKTTETSVLLDKNGESFYLVDQAAGSGGAYLFFHKNTKIYNRNSAGDANCLFEIYEKTDDTSVSTKIPGYKKVTDVSNIVSGNQYLIATTGDDGAYYVLYPSSDTGHAWAHVAKVVK